MAYQSFGSGLDDDAFVAVRELARRGVPAFVANSFAKNFSLYGERCGGLHVICDDAAADRVLGQLTSAVCANYSNPPTYGAKIVTQVRAAPRRRHQLHAVFTGIGEYILLAASLRLPVKTRYICTSL